MMMGCGVAAAQPLVSVGVKGGVPITEPMKYGDESKRYLVGASVELRLPRGFAVELDALYQRVGRSTDWISTLPYYSRDRGNQWQFPLLAKYYFQPKTKSWQPYVGAGYAVRAAWMRSSGQSYFTDQNGVMTPYKFDYKHSTSADLGATFTSGIRFHAGRIAISPEVRYTRWGESTAQTKQNEVNFLVGISF